MPIPTIDLFAGPGGLNEGFSHLRGRDGNRIFRTVLSVECEETAHRTLELRAMYRRLHDAGQARDYFRYVTKEISRETLFELHPGAAAEARDEALKATLGESETANAGIEDKIAQALCRAGSDECVIIGGPPCQAYSLVGRARRKNDEEFEEDTKHFLYREYLRIVRRFQPAVFVMENVPGLLSAKHKGARMFEMICSDLRSAGYDLHPLDPTEMRAEGTDSPREFVVAADEFGVPQARSRVFILGLRKNLGLRPAGLVKASEPAITVKDVLGDLPRIRSKLSKEPDNGVAWRSAILELRKYQFGNLDPKFVEALHDRLDTVSPNYPLGERSMRRTKSAGPAKLADWYLDGGCDTVLNHNSRGHMRSDLNRYFFWSAYASHFGHSPKISAVPSFLRPNHENIKGNAKDMPFADRFRVQMSGRPSTTIMSHISADGNYYIHYEPRQCRSLSVREASRLQTFPDNYFFEGPPTDQYRQVGNAVPPYLAKQIAGLVHSILAGEVKLAPTGT